MKKRHNISIDIIKCIAALFITNSHMDKLYGDYDFLATGGAIGDAMFFFCSGFTLFLGQMQNFGEWYKRRINRIYPTVFAWAIIGAFIFNKNVSMDYIIIHGGGWFVTCIMIYYIILYFIRKFFINYLRIVWGICSLIIVLWYYFLDISETYSIYGATYFKWGFFFLFMLQGSILGIVKIRNLSFKYDFIKFLTSVLSYYIFLIFAEHIEIINKLQILSLIPLFMITYYAYRLCNSQLLKSLYENKYCGGGIKLIGGLCLEIYLVQTSLFTDKMNGIFPLNIPIMFVIIFVAAYILRCTSRIFSQTFKDTPYNWKEVFKFI